MCVLTLGASLLCSCWSCQAGPGTFRQAAGHEHQVCCSPCTGGDWCIIAICAVRCCVTAAVIFVGPHACWACAAVLSSPVQGHKLLHCFDLAGCLSSCVHLCNATAAQLTRGFLAVPPTCVLLSLPHCAAPGEGSAAVKRPAKARTAIADAKLGPTAATTGPKQLRVRGRPHAPSRTLTAAADGSEYGGYGQADVQQQQQEGGQQPGQARRRRRRRRRMRRVRVGEGGGAEGGGGDRPPRPREAGGKRQRRRRKRQEGAGAGQAGNGIY